MYTVTYLKLMGISPTSYRVGDPRIAKGNPNIGQIAKEKSTGPRTEIGKLRALIMRDNITHGRGLKFKRECNTCPLKPIIIKDREVMQCPHYKEGSRCRLVIGEWKYRLKAYFLAEKCSHEEMQRIIARDAYTYSLMNADVESIKKGAPGFMTNEFLKTAQGSIDSAGKLQLEALKIEKDLRNPQTQNVQVLDMTKLIEAYQKEQNTIEIKAESKKPENPDIPRNDSDSL